MKYTFLGKNDSLIYIESEDILITDSQSALDLMMTARYDENCSRVIIFLSKRTWRRRFCWREIDSRSRVSGDN
jgi:hypothetical protein